MQISVTILIKVAAAVANPFQATMTYQEISLYCQLCQIALWKKNRQKSREAAELFTCTLYYLFDKKKRKKERKNRCNVIRFICHFK